MKIGHLWLLALLLVGHVHVSEAQQPGKVYRIGILAAGSPSTATPNLEAFRQGLRTLGYAEGENILIEVRYAAALDRLRAAANRASQSRG